jgi:hypothetical protein
MLLGSYRNITFAFSEANFKSKRRESYTGVCFSLWLLTEKLQARTETKPSPQETVLASVRHHTW